MRQKPRELRINRNLRESDKSIFGKLPSKKKLIEWPKKRNKRELKKSRKLQRPKERWKLLRRRPERKPKRQR